MFRIILIVSLGFLLAGFGSASSEPALSKNIKYTIQEDTHLKEIKRSVVVILEEKLSNDELKQLAKKIKKNDPSNYQRTFIVYHLKGEGKNGGAWATTHFNPNLEVIVHGLSKEEEAILAKPAASKIDRKILGVWLNDRPGIGSKMTIFYSKEGKLYLETSYPDGSSGKNEMIELESDKGKRIESKGGNDFGEYFIINKENRLEFWSENGNYYTAKQIE